MKIRGQESLPNRSLTVSLSATDLDAKGPFYTYQKATFASKGTLSKKMQPP